MANPEVHNFYHQILFRNFSTNLPQKYQFFWICIWFHKKHSKLNPRNIKLMRFFSFSELHKDDKIDLISTELKIFPLHVFNQRKYIGKFINIHFGFCGKWIWIEMENISKLFFDLWSGKEELYFVENRYSLNKSWTIKFILINILCSVKFSGWNFNAQ